MTTPPPPGDWLHAPDRLVGMVAALTGPFRPDPPGEQTAAQWYRQIRRVVDQVWVEGWLAGVTDYAARIPPRMDPAATAPVPPAVAAAAGRTGPGRATVPTRQRTRS